MSHFIRLTSLWCLPVAILFTHCQRASTGEDDDRNSANVADVKNVENTFTYDREFLARYHPDNVLLHAPDGPGQALIVPAYQGRVMTSTIAGAGDPSFGWINYDLIQSQELQPHFNAFGGEDRFWLGPEGGQYAIFFPPGSDFTFEDWKTPSPIDTEPFKLLESDAHSVSFSKNMVLTNYSGFTFQLEVARTIRMLTQDALEEQFGVSLPDSVNYVAFASENTITNTGDQPWQKAKGLLSIWILGMFNPSDQTTIVVPYQTEAPSSVPVVNSDYFGDVPSDRLTNEAGVIYFKGDGKYRSKIGVPPKRAKSMAGSYDAGQQTLTLVHFTYDEEATDYVNSMWEMQDEPYGGDVMNAYNDGAIEGGNQLGPFYELESSSAAVALSPQQSLTHTHTTMHLIGEKRQLEAVAREVLGVSLDQISSAF